MKLPKGLLILGAYFIVTGLFALKNLFYPIDYAVLFNVVLKGITLQIVNCMFFVIHTAIGMGLLMQKRWSYIMFLINQLGAILLLASNAILIKKPTLLHAGWSDRTEYDTVFMFRVFMMLAILFQFALVFVGSRYKGIFHINPHRP